jgi:hypothetical protein
MEKMSPPPTVYINFNFDQSLLNFWANLLIILYFLATTINFILKKLNINIWDLINHLVYLMTKPEDEITSQIKVEVKKKEL